MVYHPFIRYLSDISLNIAIREIIPDIPIKSHVTLERIITPDLEPVRYLTSREGNSDLSLIRALQGAVCVFSMFEVWIV